MGSPESEPERGEDEIHHPVRISQGFFMGIHPVTQREFRQITNRSPSLHSGDFHPVDNVNWADAMEYCRLLTDRMKIQGRLPKGMICRLPTEAEWEYAARAGTVAATTFGNQLGSAQANFNGESPYHGAAVGPNRGQTTPVGQFPANAWGLHDMHGNVWEWVFDDFHEYPDEPETDPCYRSQDDDCDEESYHVLRGGSWNSTGAECRSAYRFAEGNVADGNDIGFRVVIGTPAQ